MAFEDEDGRISKRVFRHHLLHPCIFCGLNYPHLIVFQTDGWQLERACMFGVTDGDGKRIV